MGFLHQSLLKVFRVFGVALVVALILVVLANIVCREGFGIALVWANEVAVTLFVWVAFVGAGISFAENARIRFTFLTDKLPERVGALIEILVTYVGLVLLGGFIATSLYVSYVHRHETFATVPVTVIWEWAAIPVGTALALTGWIRHGRWTFAQAATRAAARLAGT
jgi:TRAP-type C4-dicarboxylate transport system permease small subunit